MRIAICGATGFVGSHLTPTLAAAGHDVVAISRGRTSRRRSGAVETVHLDIAGDVAALERAFAGCDAVINLVGIDHERGAQTFARVHELGAVHVVAAATAANVAHLIQLSAVGAEPDPAYPFLATKWAAEEVVRLGSVPNTVIRAATLFGPGDHFFTRLTRMLRLARVVAPIVGNGTSVLQPLAVDDLVRIIVATLAVGPSRRVISVGGPDITSLDEIVATITRATGLRRFIVHISPQAIMPAAFLMSKLMRNPSLTPERLRLLGKPLATRRDSVATQFGFEPVSFAAAVHYLENY